MAGQSQSPDGSFAVTSTRPYLIRAPALVLMRADLTGGTIVPFVVFVAAMQSVNLWEVQVWDLVRSIMASWIISFSSWRVGLMVRMLFWMKRLAGLVVVCSNWPFLELR
jgi:hypothetical protein